VRTPDVELDPASTLISLRRRQDRVFFRGQNQPERTPVSPRT
jgi:hypothetical protein